MEENVGKRTATLTADPELDDTATTDEAGSAPDAGTDTGETKEVGFYNIFDGTKGRTDGRYLDMDERIEAEQTRILRGVPTEGVDFDNIGELPPGVGTPLVTKAQLPDNSVYSNPSVLLTDPEQESDPVFTADVPVEDTTSVASDTTYADMAKTEPGETPGVTTTGSEPDPVLDTPENTEDEVV